jgi:hypothetical protein
MNRKRIEITGIGMKFERKGMHENKGNGLEISSEPNNIRLTTTER